MKARWKHYWKPTPKRIRQIGDALYATFGMAGIGAAVEDYKWISIACWSLGMLGKFLSNFFQDESTTNIIGEPGNN